MSKEKRMKTKVLISLLCFSILSSHAQWQELQTFNLSFTQLPPVEYDAPDSITLENGKSILLDTVVHLKGTESYAIDWFVKQDGNFIKTANLIEVNKDTSIYFQITSLSTCTVFDSTHIQLTKATAIKHRFNWDQNIKIYPNPSGGKISIHIVGLSGSIDLCLFDMRGNKILCREDEIPVKNYTIELDLYDYYSGIYIIKVVSKNIAYFQKISLLK